MNMTLSFLLRTKFTQYLGRIRRSRLSLISLLMIYLSWMGIISFSALILRVTGGLGASIEQYVESLVVMTVSIILATGAFLGSKGGITALGYELDYVLTSSISPLMFLLTDLVFQLILLNLFIVPPSMLIILVLTYPHQQFLHLVSLLLMYEAAIFTSSITAHIIGVSRHWIGESRSKLIGWLTTLIMLLPILLQVFGAQLLILKDLHPSYLLGSITTGDIKPQSISLYAVYLVLLISIYLKVAKTNFYASVTPVLLSALMEPPRKLPRYLKLPGLSNGLLGINSKDGLLKMMVKLHLTRILRDGSLWTALLIFVIFTLANIALPRLLRIEAFPEVAQLTLIALYTPLFPALLSINWSISERQNLWIVKLTEGSQRSYVSALFYAYFLLTLIFSLCLYGFISLGAREVPFLEIDLLLLAAMSIFSALFSILTSFRLRKIPSAFSLSSFLYVLVPLFGSSMLSLPILMVRLFEPLASSPNFQLLANVAIFIVIVSIVFYKVLTSSFARQLPE